MLKKIVNMLGILDNLFHFISFKTGVLKGKSRSSLSLLLPWELLREFLDSTLKKTNYFFIITIWRNFKGTVRGLRPLNRFVHKEKKQMLQKKETKSFFQHYILTNFQATFWVFSYIRKNRIACEIDEFLVVCFFWFFISEESQSSLEDKKFEMISVFTNISIACVAFWRNFQTVFCTSTK